MWRELCEAVWRQSFEEVWRNVTSDSRNLQSRDLVVERNRNPPTLGQVFDAQLLEVLLVVAGLQDDEALRVDQETFEEQTL